MSFWSKYKARSWPYTGGVAIPPGAYRDQKRRKTSLPNTLSEKKKNSDVKSKPLFQCYYRCRKILGKYQGLKFEERV